VNGLWACWISSFQHAGNIVRGFAPCPVKEALIAWSVLQYQRSREHEQHTAYRDTCLGWTASVRPPEPYRRRVPSQLDWRLKYRFLERPANCIDSQQVWQPGNVPPTLGSRDRWIRWAYRLIGRRGCCFGWVRTDYLGRRAIRSCGDGWMTSTIAGVALVQSRRACDSYHWETPGSETCFPAPR